MVSVYWGQFLRCLAAGVIAAATSMYHAPLSFAEELVLVSPHWEGYRREFEEGFRNWRKKKYPTGDISYRWLDLGGASDIAKTLLARNEAGSPLAVDVLFGGGVDQFLVLKSKGILKAAKPSPEVIASIPLKIHGSYLRDPDNYWFGVNLTSFGIAFNKPLLTQLKLPFPKTFEELTKPEYRGWIGSADPRRSGSVRFIYELILQAYGWEKGWQTIYKISSNVRSFNNNASQTPKDLSTGEIAAGLLIDSYGLDIVEKIGEEYIGFTVPLDVRTFFF